jgi:uncharacterized protein YutE (UPF0331/DUF86 family)
LAVDREVVGARLTILEENLRLLGQFAQLDLPIEAVFDIGTHLISALALARPLAYGEILPALAEAGVISQETLEELTNLAGFRNLLVHEYVRLDRSRVHAFLTTHLTGLRRFAADIAGQLT